MGTHLGAAAPNFRFRLGRVDADGTLPLSWEDIILIEEIFIGFISKFIEESVSAECMKLIHKLEWYRVRQVKGLSSLVTDNVRRRKFFLCYGKLCFP